MAWQIRGEYFETCSCDYLCPCIPSNLAARPTEGWCVFAFAQHIDGQAFGLAIDHEQIDEPFDCRTFV